MDDEPNELGLRRAKKAHGEGDVVDWELEDEPLTSEPEQRGDDVRLSARQELTVQFGPGGPTEIDLLLAAYDRAAAALERYRASVDRQRAAEQLRTAFRDELTGALHRDMGRPQ